MIGFVLRRLLGAVWVLAGVGTVVFIILHLTGDPATIMMPPDATAADIANFRHLQGFDRPLVVQYGDFAWKALHGDFGDSLRHNEPAVGLALERVPATAELSLAALLIAIAIAIPSGIIAATKRNSPLDYVVRVVSLIGQSAPVYWLGLMLILVFGVALGWFPVSGKGGWQHLIMPAFTLGAFSMAKLMRLTRSSMLDIMRSDFLRTASAKGVPPLRLLTKHALRNAWLPIITTIGVELGTLLSGAIITETVFAWPGIGRLVVQAINDRDYPLVEVIVLLAAAAFVILNLIVDITYAALDPRIRYE